MKSAMLVSSTLLLGIAFTSSFAYLPSSTGPTNPTPGLPCTTPVQAA